MTERNAPKSSKQPEKAIALHYKSEDELPRVLTQGVGEAANQIIKLAKELGIPITEDTDLTELLAEIPAGSSISPKMYRLVAQMIAFIYHVDQKWKAEHEFLEPILEER